MSERGRLPPQGQLPARVSARATPLSHAIGRSRREATPTARSHAPDVDRQRRAANGRAQIAGRGGARSLVTVAGNNAPPRGCGGRAGASGRSRGRRRHRDCSPGDCYLPTGTNTQPPPPPPEPLPELPARTPGDRCGETGGAPSTPQGGLPGPRSFTPKRPSWGVLLRTPMPSARRWVELLGCPRTLGESLGDPGDPSLYFCIL